jgi:hypothetical protein
MEEWDIVQVGSFERIKRSKSLVQFWKLDNREKMWSALSQNGNSEILNIISNIVNKPD